MVSLADIWTFIKSSPARIPTVARIPEHRVLQPIGGPEIVVPHEHYFAIQVDSIFLESRRRWFREVDPVVLAISEYRYGDKPVSLPFIIGPALLREHESKVPQGMLYRRTRVAGIHPYRGGQLVTSLILCQSTTEDYARRLVSLVEGLADAVPFGEELGTYTRLAGNLLDGVDALFGVAETQPLVGFREEYDHDIHGQELRPGYGVLIDDDSAAQVIKRLWVSDGDLMIGDARDSLEPFREASYVLYSIRGIPKLHSLKSLPLTADDIEIRRLLRSPKEENQELGRARLLDLWDRLLASPDVTEVDARAHLEGLMQAVEADRRLLGAQRLSGHKAEPEEDRDDPQVLANRRSAIDRISKL